MDAGKVIHWLSVSKYTARSTLGEELMGLLHATDCSWRSLRLHDDNSCHYHPGSTADLPGIVHSWFCYSKAACTFQGIHRLQQLGIVPVRIRKRSLRTCPGLRRPGLFTIWHPGYSVSLKRRRRERRAGWCWGHDTTTEGEVMRIWVPIKRPLNAPLSDSA